MAIPLEKESKMWGLFFNSDFHKLMVCVIGNALAFMGFVVWWGLEGGLVVFFSVMVILSVYFIMKSFWPEKHLENIMRFHNESKVYFPRREEREL